jgi:hypothetical protein
MPARPSAAILALGIVIAVLLPGRARTGVAVEPAAEAETGEAA